MMINDLVNSLETTSDFAKIIKINHLIYNLFYAKNKHWLSSYLINACDLSYDDISSEMCLCFVEMFKLWKQTNYPDCWLVTVMLIRARNIIVSRIRHYFNLSNKILTESISLPSNQYETKIEVEEQKTIEDEVRNKYLIASFISRLNDREQQILKLKLIGYNFDQIAKKLNLKKSSIVYMFNCIKNNKNLTGHSYKQNRYIY